MKIALNEMMETINMVQMENLDIRTVTMGISLYDCADSDFNKMNSAVYKKITTYASKLTEVAQAAEKEYGIPIINKRISITPIAEILGNATVEQAIELAKTLDKAAKDLNVDFIGGYSALVHKGITKGDQTLLDALPEALAVTERVCSSISVATTRTGINMDAVKQMGIIIKNAAERTKDQNGLACAKLVVFCNPVEDNPFMAGAFHGAGEGEVVLNVGVSGPGVVLNALRKYPDADLGEVSDIIKKTTFKITRAGELIGRVVAERLGVPFGIMDLSLAPTNAINDSVADILEEIGLERVGTHGTIAALALMNDAVKKGGAMASSYVGGLSGAFIPVSEDNGMIRGILDDSLTLSKLEAMTCVCSVGLDMIALTGDVSPATLSAIIADEAAIGMINKKTTAVRVIPVPGKKEGEMVEFGGLLGRAPVMGVNPYSSQKLVDRGGRIPSPLQALIN
ncbi:MULTISPECIES: PFL family protein [unclassified Niallia]|uniref:PFL family protein n=1 Tax=Niallia TaxID=2837506 RepID=UPI001EDAC6AC|nr:MULTISPECIES: PFL family protein [unclassified Niallia]MCM3029159.1 PFL family protein [Niallia sp. MER 6]MDL0434954.1 PFL family protein [Niallia sp. SS-2023]UPO88762.1 PFL family protein [Niallia sp. Man26]